MPPPNPASAQRSAIGLQTDVSGAQTATWRPPLLVETVAFHIPGLARVPAPTQQAVKDGVQVRRDVRMPQSKDVRLLGASPGPIHDAKRVVAKILSYRQYLERNFL